MLTVASSCITVKQPGRGKAANPHCEIVSRIQAEAAAMQSAALVEKVSAKGTKVAP